MEEKDSVDGLMLEVTEAVAQHWRNVWVYYLVLALSWMIGAFFDITFIAAAKSVWLIVFT